MAKGKGASVKWLAEIFPEAVLNLRPGDRIKRPLQIDAG